MSAAFAIGLVLFVLAAAGIVVVLRGRSPAPSATEAPVRAAPAPRRLSRRSARAAPVEEVDDELRDVFVTEARGEIGHLRRALPYWRSVPADLDRAVPLRRSFHTLKGSSRLVGAPVIGDFCAAIERLLLAVVEGSVLPEPAVIDTIARAVATLPALLGEFTGERATRTDVSALVRTAEHLRGDAPAPR
ncbi:Hpt domain-containing protein [Dokdonella fugitiva]|jgi:chemotaxis protein histidine kinase CheA|uniref:Hpt domain-containing protein n=1 Tax=Dokdonella fugitiva TaxID=328517 RepID=A0A4R2IHI2_9GAMM|nr:Hpt domain-containing protein [Dokdonella fugitiva]MBA8882818.1 chemotaxis protein histidine kinase CheA [Dokdonella fugitiva]TCO43208.1 Hpt domain-containing protein [Dokdonella fugitiva]